LKWDREHLKYYGISLVIFFLFFVPQIVYYTQASHAKSINNYSGYFNTYYHGFHARRVLQLAPDAFIKFQSIMQVPYEKLKLLMFFYVPVFFVALLWKDKTKKTWLLCLVTALWFIIPWFVFSTYKGELTDYYFSSTLYVAIMILAWLSHALWMKKFIIFRVALVLFWGYFAVANYYQFMGSDDKQDFKKNFIFAMQEAEAGRYYNYADGDPKSYMYYYHMYNLKKELPYKL
jgi:4-amino-4-deoxy-L-arabinose transferase-like glycosyltransferase